MQFIISRRLSYIPSDTILIILRLVFKGQFNQGDWLNLFESNYSQKLDRVPCVCTSYGLHALYIILKYYEFNEKTVLLIPNYTSIVVKNLLKEMKIPYRTIKVDKQSSLLCVEDLINIIDENVKAVLVTHLMGNVCNENVFSFLNENNVKIIEDCAHAHGATLNGQPVGTLGDAAFFSFDSAKIINTFTGGLLVSKDEALIRFARKQIDTLNYPGILKSIRCIFFAYKESVFNLFPSFLARIILKNKKNVKFMKNFFSNRKFNKVDISEFRKFQNYKAWLGWSQLNKLGLINQKREYRAEFIKDRLKGEFEFLHHSVEGVYYYLIVFVQDSNYYQKELIKLGIDTSSGEEIMQVLNKTDVNDDINFVLNQYLQIPIHHKIGTKQLIYICNSLLSIKKIHSCL